MLNEERGSEITDMNQKLKEELIWVINDHPGLEPGLKERSIKESGNELVGEWEER